MENITTLAVVKNTGYLAVLIATTTYLQITTISVQVLSVLIVSDVFTGILRSGTIDGWSSIKSSILQRGVIAKVLLITVPFVLALTGKGVGISLSTVAQSTINVLILSEAYSIIGNLYAIRTGEEKKEFDAVAFVLNQVKGLLKKVIIED